MAATLSRRTDDIFCLSVCMIQMNYIPDLNTDSPGTQLLSYGTSGSSINEVEESVIFLKLMTLKRFAANAL